MTGSKKSVVGFAIVKIAVAGTAYFLMRLNPKWRDVNFVGGHAKERDAGNLERTARGELWEEVPSIRRYNEFHLEPLTSKIHYGPIDSLSRGGTVEYELQFFLACIERSPEMLVETLGSRSKNIWVPQHELLFQRRLRVSGLVRFLHDVYPGGLDNIPYSSGTDLGPMKDLIVRMDGKQLEFALK